MIESDQAIVKPDVTIGQFEVINRVMLRKSFDKILQFITPIAKTAAQRKGEVQLIQEFITCQQAVQQATRIAIMDLYPFFTRDQFTAASKGAKGQERPRCYVGIPRSA